MNCSLSVIYGVYQKLFLHLHNMSRPKFENIETGNEFNTWYWLKSEMVDILRKSGLPSTGRKFELRDRIMFALDNGGRSKSEPKRRKAKSHFNWAREELTNGTRITDNVSFGPNFRNFMKSRIGDKFSCNSDFMDWVKENEGKTLEQAVLKWKELDDRSEDPTFRREIAANNMFNQYIRDFMDSNPHKALKDARRFWLLKKKLPTENGFIRYSDSDLNLVD